MGSYSSAGRSPFPTDIPGSPNFDSVRDAAYEYKLPINKVHDALLNQKPNDKIKDKEKDNMKYFVYHLDECLEYDGSFLSKHDAIKFIQNTLPNDITIENIYLIEGTRVKLERKVVEVFNWEK